MLIANAGAAFWYLTQYSNAPRKQAQKIGTGGVFAVNPNMLIDACFTQLGKAVPNFIDPYGTAYMYVSYYPKTKHVQYILSGCCANTVLHLG